MTAPTPPDWRIFAALGISVCSALVVGACARTVDPVPVAAEPQAAAETTNADAGLTTVPPLDEQYPELFNEQGCALGPITPALDDLPPEVRAAIIESLPPEAQQQIADGGQIDLDSIPSDVLGKLLDSQRSTVVDCNMSGETPDTPREFFGYLGSNAGRLSPGEVEARVLDRDDGRWQAAGLAVPPDAGGTVTITATLRDAQGEVVGEASSASPVRGARPGEPVPFVISSDADASVVATVDYDVHDDTSDDAGSHTSTINRSFTILLEGIVADGDNAVILGSVENASATPAHDPSGVIAVHAPSTAGGTHAADTLVEFGLVEFGVLEFVVTEPGTNRAISQLEPGFSGTFEVVVADPSHQLTTDDVEVWVFAS